jgi:dCTP deaminase
VSGFWSSETLHARLNNLISPYDAERVRNCSYELSLGNEVFITGERGKTKRVLACLGEQITIEPGQFADLLTEEVVRIPASALGLISMKFGVKKSGLVNVSGFHVDPGYDGKLLFSVYNAGPSPTVLSRGDPVFLLWYCDLDQETTDLYGNNPRRDSITTDDVSQLQGDVLSPQALALKVAALERQMSFWTWLGRVIVVALISGLIGLGIGWGEHIGGPASDLTPTTTTVPTPSTSH